MSGADPMFRGRVAVVTGGASGIGFALAEALAREGCRLVLADVESGALGAAVDRISAGGAEVHGVVTDVSRRESVFALADATWARFGAAHLVFHNAGVMTYGPTQFMQERDWLFNLNVNLWGPIYGVEAFTRRMLEQREGGYQVFTASFAGLVPNRNFGPYNVAKAGVVALAESLRKDLQGTGIDVSVVCPMIVDTNIVNSTRNRPDELGGPVRTEVTEEERSYFGRILTPAALADLVLAGMRAKRPFIHSHKEGAPLVQKRAERIMAAFDHAL